MTYYVIILTFYVIQYFKLTVSSTNIGTFGKYEQRQLWK